MITVSKRDFVRQILPDDCPDASYLEQDGFEERLQQYRQGRFRFMGIRAAVDAPITHAEGVIPITIETPGLWGIESDGDEGYFDVVYQEECDILADMLAQLGVTVAE